MNATRTHDQLLDEGYENVSRALSYLNLCIGACESEQMGLFDMGVVLLDIRALMTTLLTLLDELHEQHAPAFD